MGHGVSLVFVVVVKAWARVCGRERNRAEDNAQAQRHIDTLPEWSKGVDSSSTSASCVGSNPTGVNCLKHCKQANEM